LNPFGYGRIVNVLTIVKNVDEKRKTLTFKELRKRMESKQQKTRITKWIAGLCIALFIISIAPLATPAPSTLIRDNHGHTWTATSANLITAFKTLQTGSELWIPAGNFTISNANLIITKNNVKIHGAGTSTYIYFKNGGRMISGLYASSTSDSARYRYGVNNLLLENFRISGYGCLEVVLGDNTTLKGIQADHIYTMSDQIRPAAIRFVLPTSDHTANGLKVIRCKTYKTFDHGFQINGVATNGQNTLTNVLFDNCSASYAGWQYPGRPQDYKWNWSVGFDLGEGYNDCVVSLPSIKAQYCTATYNWEGGFHMESAIQRSLTLSHCRADYNGQKRVKYPNTTAKYYCSGFVAENGVTLSSCTANYNTNYGVLRRNSPVIIGMTGVGNWKGLYPAK
jgi:hypothetical protein